MVLHRYIAKQIIGPFLIAAVSLNLLFVLVQVLKMGEITFRAGLSLPSLVWVTVLFLPYFAVFTIPVSVLMGVLLGFGRMAEDGELVAVATAGISPMRLALVPLFLALVTTALMIFLSAWLAPHSASQLHNIFVDLAKRQIVSSLRPGSFFQDTLRLTLYPHRAHADGQSFDGFLIYDHRSGRIPHAMFAKRAAVRPDPRRNLLSVDLYDGQIHAPDPKRGHYSLVGFRQASIFIDVDRLVRNHAGMIPELDRMAMRALWTEGQNPLAAPKERNRHMLAWHQRLSFPTACLLFGLLGTCLGATGRLKSRRNNLLASMFIVALYYLLMRFGDAMVFSNWLGPASVAWLPNGIIALVVFWWMVRWGRKPG